MQVRACYTPHLTGDLGHRALVARQNARGDPKRMGDPSRYVPADLRKNGMRDDHRDQKMDAKKKDAKKKDAMKVDDLSHYVPDVLMLNESMVGNPGDHREM